MCVCVCVCNEGGSDRNETGTGAGRTDHTTQCERWEREGGGRRSARAFACNVCVGCIVFVCAREPAGTLTPRCQRERSLQSCVLRRGGGTGGAERELLCVSGGGCGNSFNHQKDMYAYPARTVLDHGQAQSHLRPQLLRRRQHVDHDVGTSRRHLVGVRNNTQTTTAAQRIPQPASP